MEKEFWLAKWQDQQIGFHKTDIHPCLLKYWDRLELSSTASVLVPLCGKSVDLLYLHQLGHTVTGVELSGIAAQAFFDENQLAVTKEKVGEFEILSCQRLRIIVGDLFAVTPSLLGPIEGIYDRAALVALPESMRTRYRDHCRVLGGTSHATLLVTLEYGENVISPPPFSLDKSAVDALYQGHYQVTHLETQPTEIKDKQGLESVYLLEAFKLKD